MNVGDNYNRPKVSAVIQECNMSSIVAERTRTIMEVNNAKLPFHVAMHELSNRGTKRPYAMLPRNRDEDMVQVQVNT